MSQTKLDSLASVLEQTTSDTQRLTVLNLLSAESRRAENDLSASRAYAEEAFALANKLHDDLNRARAIINLGNIELKEGNYSKVLKDTSIQLPIVVSTADRKVMANYYTLMANCLNKQGDLSRALSNFLISLKHFEAIDDSIGIGSCYNNIGIVNAMRGNYEESLKWFMQNLAMMERANDTKRIISVLGNIGNIHSQLGNYESALEYYGRSLDLSKAHNSVPGMASAFNNIGVLQHNMKLYDKALENHRSALELYEQLGRKQNIAGANINLAGEYTMLGKFREAESHLNTGLSLAKQIGHMEYTRNAYEKLATLDSARGNYAAALHHYKFFKLYADSLLNESSSRQLNEMQTKYDTEKKDHEIVLLNKDNELQQQEIGRQKLMRNGFIGGFAVMLLFAGVFFFQRNRIAKEKQRSEELLLNILPEEVADELKEKGHSDAQLIDEVTVLFTDFKGFTALSEKVTPKELVKDLHECFSAFDNICEKYGIEKIKTIGDAYMAAGGLPVPNSTHAADCVKAAMEMREFVEMGKKKKVDMGLPYFEIRIGIHTGPVVAGIVGVKKFQYDIWGDTVNTASRMESSGEVGKVNISETTYERLKDDPEFSFENRGKVAAKGKGELEMYFVSSKA
jgi:class 3 adenylate cyclase/tetratricopeptide (TPR) repeat protein